MDAFILVFTLGIMLAIGVPVAYAVGISAIIGAWYIDIPLEAVMIQLTSGVNKFSLLAIPFFILAGAIMAEGGIARYRRFLRRPAITRLSTRWQPVARCRLPRCSSPGSCRGCC